MDHSERKKKKMVSTFVIKGKGKEKDQSKRGRGRRGDRARTRGLMLKHGGRWRDSLVWEGKTSMTTPRQIRKKKKKGSEGKSGNEARKLGPVGKERTYGGREKPVGRPGGKPVKMGTGNPERTGGRERRRKVG